MANLTYLEKLEWEKLLEMASGYVLNFSNKTFQLFVAGTVGRDIFDRKYLRGSGSKANCLRGFWTEEPNHVVGKLLNGLLEYCTSQGLVIDPGLNSRCKRTADRLLKDVCAADIEILSELSADSDFEAVAGAVKDSIEKNEPDKGLDRLHTFTIKYVRHLCEKHGIPVDRDKALHSLFGEYVKHLKKNSRLESVMTERILKTSISILEAFNDVRNNQSLAHDNQILNYAESVLIFSNVTSSVRFISSLEKRIDLSVVKNETASSEDVPF